MRFFEPDMSSLHWSPRGREQEPGANGGATTAGMPSGPGLQRLSCLHIVPKEEDECNSHPLVEPSRRA
jgi:hypothetical protein